MSTAGGETEYPPFDFRIRLGIVFITESASLSALAVASLLAYIAYSVITIRQGASRSWTMSTHIHLYFVNLLVSDLIQAIGGVMNSRWVAEAAVTEGTYCTVQGIFKQMGDVGVALSTMSIALHTFFVLVFQWRSSPKVALVVVILIWIFIALVIGISMAVHKGEDYYGNTQYWCWITEDFGTQRIALEYLWLWMAAFVNILCYLFIALVVKGVIVIDSGKIRRRRHSEIGRDTASTPSNRSNAIALQMLFYPAVYIVTVFPLSVVRWMAFTGITVPFPATCVASVLFSSSGLLNVILFSLTRPGLVPNRANRFGFDPDNTRLPITSVVSYPPVHVQSRSNNSHSGPESPPRVYRNELDDWKHGISTDSRGEIIPFEMTTHSPITPPSPSPRHYAI